MLVDPDDQPRDRAGARGDRLLDERAPAPGRERGSASSTRPAPSRAVVEAIDGVVDMDTLEQHDATEMGLNDIGTVRLRLSAPLMVDPYAENRATGAFILVDEATNDTVAAGMVRSRDVARGLSVSARSGQGAPRPLGHAVQRVASIGWGSLPIIPGVAQHTNICSILTHAPVVPRRAVPHGAQPGQGHAVRVVAQPVRRAACTAARSATSAAFERRADRPCRRPLRPLDPRQDERRRGAAGGARAPLLGAARR